jgi:hypothetical protein
MRGGADAATVTAGCVNALLVVSACAIRLFRGGDRSGLVTTSSSTSTESSTSSMGRRTVNTGDVSEAGVSTVSDAPLRPRIVRRLADRLFAGVVLGRYLGARSMDADRAGKSREVFIAFR